MQQLLRCSRAKCIRLRLLLQAEQLRLRSSLRLPEALKSRSQTGYIPLFYDYGGIPLQKTYRFFLPWKYIAETDEVNARSRQGFHLVSSSRFCRKEEIDPSVCWYYRLDHRDTALLHEKQGWELVCRQGKWCWFRKKVEENAPDSAYVLHGAERHAAEEHLRGIVKALDTLRNLLLIVTLILILLPSELTANWTPRAACIPLFLAILPVKAAGEIRKLLGEEQKSK